MNVSDLSVTYAISGNRLTVTSAYPSNFQIQFMLICFLSLLPANTSYELGNIETFLCNDSYYPYTSIGERYSYIQHDEYILNTTNCVRTEAAGPKDFNITENIGPPWVAFLDRTGTVRGPKTGIVANTSVYKYSNNYVKYVIETVKREWNSRRISAGTIEAMIPDLLMHKTQCIDEEIVIMANRTIYDNLGPDPRNPLDATRNKGLFPKCSSKDCFNGGFTSKFNGQSYRLHDHMFRVNLVLELADKVLSENSHCQ